LTLRHVSFQFSTSCFITSCCLCLLKGRKTVVVVWWCCLCNVQRNCSVPKRDHILVSSVFCTFDRSSLIAFFQHNPGCDSARKNVYWLTVCLCGYYSISLINFLQQSWSCIILVSYQSFYIDLNAVQSPGYMHAGLVLLISGAWEHCLESKGTSLFASRMWGG